MGKKESPLVSIRCTVYNHEPYLRQCLDGFVMQKTNFAFEAIVHDDASTDNSAEIIREYAEKYPDIIKPIYETENQYSKQDGSLDKIMNENTHGKYVAFCEGDDFWTDPLKLQKQVDILEKNSNIGLVFSKVKYWNQSKQLFEKDFGEKTNYNKLLYYGNTIPTLSICCRKNILDTYYIDINPNNHNWKMGDYPLWLYISRYYNLYYIDETQGVYRLLEESASHSKNINKAIDFLKSYTEIRMFFHNKYDGNKRCYNKILEAHVLGLYRIIMEYNGDINLVKKELKHIDFFSFKLSILKIALSNKFLNSLVIRNM